MSKYAGAVLLAACILLLAGTAHAGKSHDRYIAGVKLGGIVPLDGLEPFVQYGVEVGYALPVPTLGRRIAVVLDVDYTEPMTTGTETDPRVAGGMYTWTLIQEELGVMPAILYRATFMKRIVPYGGVGFRMLFLKSTVADDGTPPIEDTTEVSMKFGVGVPVGAELKLGPGRLIAELLCQYGGLDHVATGDSHTGGISLSVGYRFIF
jgi:hypothetical protein